MSDAKVTTAEGATWAAFAIAALVYVIAFFVGQNAETESDDLLAAGWMTLAGMIAGLTVVPAIILTGLRQLVPALRGVRAGEGESANSK